MDIFSDIGSTFSQFQNLALYLFVSIVIMLVVIFFMYKTYKASLNVEARLAEFSSLTSNVFGKRLKLIETEADAYHLNKAMLGPLARIIDEYCVVVTDSNGAIAYANDRYLSLSGFDLKQLVGTRQTLRTTNAEARPEQNGISVNTLANKVWHGEICNRSRAGKVYWLDTFAFPLALITDSDEGYIFLGTDITAIKSHNTQLMREMKRTEEKINKVESMLLHSEKMASLGAISAGIAHEINNPISFVASNVSRLEDYIGKLALCLACLKEELGDEKLHALLALKGGGQPSLRDLNYIIQDSPDLVQETSDGIDRIRKIISDLKSFSHDQDQPAEPVDIHKCLETSLNLARHETRKAIRIRKAFGAKMPVVLGSETQLTQVFLNLVVNSAQAMSGKGEIEISTGIQNGFCVVSVADNGPGIDQSVMDRIFEPFFTTKPVGQGTGLGLSISHDIVKRHGGTIAVDSTPGQGTTFTLRFPSADSSRLKDNHKSHAA